MFKKYKIEIIIFTLAIVLRLATASVMYSQSDYNYDNFLGNIRNDGYYIIAENLINYRVFSYDAIEPILPNSKRTPGYPMMIIASLYIFNSIWLLLIFQIIVSSLLPLLGRKISIEMTNNKKSSNLVAFLLAVEPMGIWLSVKLLNETLFTFFFLIFILLIFKFIKINKTSITSLNYKIITSAGIILAIATLIKPTTYYFPVIIILGWLVYRILTKQKLLLKYLFIYLFVFLLVVSPWLYRNYKTFGVVSFSSASQDVLFNYLAPSILAIKNNQSFPDSQDSFFKSHNFERYPEVDLDKASWFQSRATEVIKNNPKELVKISSISVLTFFTHDGTLNLLGSLNIVDSTGLTVSTIIKQPLPEMFKTLKQLIFSPVLFIILARIIWIVIAMLFFISVGSMFIKKDVTVLAVLALICVLYFALTTIANGFGVNARFRFPINVFIFIFAINFIYDIISNKNYKILKKVI